MHTKHNRNKPPENLTELIQAHRWIVRVSAEPILDFYAARNGGHRKSDKRVHTACRGVVLVDGFTTDGEKLTGRRLVLDRDGKLFVQQRAGLRACGITGGWEVWTATTGVEHGIEFGYCVTGKRYTIRVSPDEAIEMGFSVREITKGLLAAVDSALRRQEARTERLRRNRESLREFSLAVA